MLAKQVCPRDVLPSLSHGARPAASGPQFCTRAGPTLTPVPGGHMWLLQAPLAALPPSSLACTVVPANCSSKPWRPRLCHYHTAWHTAALHRSGTGDRFTLLPGCPLSVKHWEAFAVCAETASGACTMSNSPSALYSETGSQYITSCPGWLRADILLPRPPGALGLQSSTKHARSACAVSFVRLRQTPRAPLSRTCSPGRSP